MRRPPGFARASRPWLGVLAGLLAVPLAAQTELVTDRPDQTESALVVPRGSVQIETGWLRIEDEDGRFEIETEELLGTLVRVGLSDRVELRLGWAGDVEEEVELDGQRLGEISGVGDAEIGTKIHLATERGRRPEVALLAAVGLPVGEDEITSDRFDPAFRVSLAHTLSDRISFGYNLGMAWESAETLPGVRETFSFFQYTAAMGFGLSERWGAFVEVFGDLPVDAPGGAANSVDGGFTFLVRDNFQLDVSAGAGLSDSAPDRFLGLGLSVRLPR